MFVFRNIIILFMLLFFSISLNQDRIIRIFHNDHQKHALPITSDRTSLGDDYHYFILANQSLKKGIVPSENISDTNNILLGGLLVAGGINAFFYHLIPSTDIAVLSSLIIQTFILVASFFIALKCLIMEPKERDSVLIGFWVLIALIFTQAFLLMTYSNSLQIPKLLSYYPDILRVVNPQTSWAYGLVYFAFLIEFTKKNTHPKFFITLLLSLFFASFSLSLAVAISTTLGFFIVFCYILERKIPWLHSVILFFLLLSVIYTYTQVHYFQISPRGLEIGTGVVKKIIFKIYYLKYLLIVVPVMILFKGAVRMLLMSVLISCVMIGAFCDSIHLGSRLWVRGAGLYVWLIFVTVLAVALKQYFKKYYVHYVGIFVCLISIYFLLPHQFDNNYGYVDRDKWVMVEWINRNLPKGSTILTDDLEFSFLLPIYSYAKPFVALFSYSQFNTEETVKRYFFSLEQINRKQLFINELKCYSKQKYIDNVLTVSSGKSLDYRTYQVQAFYSQLIYFPYTKFSETAFDETKNTNAFFNTIDKWGEEIYVPKKKPEYTLFHKCDVNNHKVDAEAVFASSKMILFKFP